MEGIAAAVDAAGKRGMPDGAGSSPDIGVLVRPRPRGAMTIRTSPMKRHSYAGHDFARKSK
ncbi:MAG TPA: hypothetical protein VGM06_04785 [Polyangiaceae bacterium]|jgi:hypothetical protein